MNSAQQASPPPDASNGVRPASFATNVLQLVVGSAAAQVLAFALAPVISRLYAPETFGAAASFAAVLTILSSMATLRYEQAILLPQDDRRAGAVALASLLVVLVICTLLCALLALLRGSALDARLRDLVAAPDLLPLAVLLSGITVVLTYWSIRQEKFRLLSRNRMVSASVAEAGRLGLGLLGRDLASSLIVANVVGVLAGVGALAHGLRRQLGPVVRARFSEALEALYQYRKFPLFASWAGLLLTLSRQLTPLVLGSFFSAEIVGFYAQANRITITPLLLLSSAITQVFARNAARARIEGDLARLTTGTLRNLLRLAWYPAVALLLLGPELTAWFLGAPWATAGRYAQILALWMLTTLMSDPLAALYAVLERQELGMALNLALLVLRVGGLAVGGLHGDPILAMRLFAGSGAALNLVQIVVLLRLAQGRLLPSLRTALRCLAYSVPLLVLTALRPLMGDTAIVAVLIALAGGLCYAGLWAATDGQLRALAVDLWQGVWRGRRRARG